MVNLANLTVAEYLPPPHCSNHTSAFMATTSGRNLPGQTYAVTAALLILSASIAAAQPPARDLRALPEPLPPPVPSDVLTPNTRQNTPYLKIAARAGLNWAAYSNDRYLDNTALDVGRTSGETDIYTHASGFAYSGGAELEYPINTGLSVVGSVEYARAQFGGEGPVQQECVRSDGATSVGLARHEWSAHLDYLKVGAVVKLGFPSFYVLGGLTAGRLLGSTVERTRELDDANCSFPGSGGMRSIVESGSLPAVDEVLGAGGLVLADGALLVDREVESRRIDAELAGGLDELVVRDRRARALPIERSPEDGVDLLLGVFARRIRRIHRGRLDFHCLGLGMFRTNAARPGLFHAPRRPIAPSSKTATTGPWSLVPTSRRTWHSCAAAARGRETKT